MGFYIVNSILWDLMVEEEMCSVFIWFGLVIEDVMDDIIDFIFFDGSRVEGEVRRYVEDVIVDNYVIFEFSDLVLVVVF